MYSVEIEGQDELNRLMQEELKWTKRQPAENLNTHLMFTGIQWMRQTKVADKVTIREKLLAKAKQYNAPLAAILVNSQLGAKGKKGLNGEAMAKAVEKKIKRDQSRVQFARAGCLGGINQLRDSYRRGDINLSNRFAPKRPQGVRQYGRAKGFAIAAKNGSVSVWGQITNTVGTGKQASKTIVPVLTDGAAKAVRIETANLLAYIRRKMTEHYNKLQKGKI